MKDVDPFRPAKNVLVKLGSIARHADEGMSEGGHQFDWNTVQSLLDDPDVKNWMTAMDQLGLLPVKR